jgi:cytochrome P450
VIALRTARKAMAAPNLPALDLDPYDPDVLRAPHDYYRRLRELGPLVWLPRYGVCASGHYAVVESVFRDHVRFTSARGVGLSDFAREPPWRAPSIILEVDPPAHERTRRVMARVLTPAAVARLKPGFDVAAEEVVARALAAGTFDAVSTLAAAYPLQVFGDAVGIEGSGRQRLLDYGRMVFDALGPDNALRRAALDTAAEVVPWIAARCARTALSADGFGAEIHAAAARGEITDEEAALLVRSLLSAGIDTTVATLGNLLYCFATHPEQWQALRCERQRLHAALDETLRFESPVHTFCRTSNASCEVGGAPMPGDCKILCVIGAANRDPTRWDAPDEFDIMRAPRAHVAFGSGIHVCVGQHVARHEIASLFAALLEGVARIELAGEPVWRPGHAVRSLAHLPLKLVAARCGAC